MSEPTSQGDAVKLGITLTEVSLENALIREVINSNPPPTETTPFKLNIASKPTATQSGQYTGSVSLVFDEVLRQLFNFL